MPPFERREAFLRSAAGTPAGTRRDEGTAPYAFT